MKDRKDHPDLRSRDFPVKENMAYQARVWRFERWGWYGLLVVIMLALLGLFSRGPLSSREAHGNDGKLSVQYEMFHRNGSSNPMTVTVQGAPNATVELELQGDLMDGFSIEILQPQPVRANSAGRGLKFWLQTDAQGRARIYLILRGDGLGRFSSTLSSPGSAAVDITQFIFP